MREWPCAACHLPAWRYECCWYESPECSAEGAAFAKKHSLPRLEIDCLGGLGCMFRAQNQNDKAVSLLEQALALCESTDDADSKASTLVNLGSALMSVGGAGQQPRGQHAHERSAAWHWAWAPGLPA